MFAKSTQFGNPFLGLYALASDSFVVAPVNCSPKFREALQTTLGGTHVFGSIGGSDLIGIFSCMNSNALIVPKFIDNSELALFKKSGLNVEAIQTKLSALGNNVAANSKAALVNPFFSKPERARIGDVLGVEVEARRVAGFDTVGSSLLVTDKGFVANNGCSDDEISFLESFFKVKGAIGTANFGAPFLRLCAVANSRGFVTGEPTTGYELGRLSEGLGLI